ncbi:MAG TPA: hypothetical protein VGD66_04760 [Allosphingosinicella sp.]|jgi:hypothetical protein
MTLLRRHKTGFLERTVLLLFAFAATAACTPMQDHVVFVTKTSLGVDFDAEPPAASIGYDRVEGYLGPRADNGSVPPVLASIQSSGGAFNSDVRQTYATGSAAVAVARGISNTAATPVGSDETIAGGLKLMFFGTSSSVGLKVAGGPSGPSSVTFGYKRKEVSVIPLARVPTAAGQPQQYRYPAVIASIDTTASAVSATGAKLTNAQFFATGLAAEYYARSPAVQAAFSDRSKEALQAFDRAETQQRFAAADILACYAGVLPDKRPQVWQDAQARGLLKAEQEKGQPVPPADQILQQLLALNAAGGNSAALASNLYATQISQPSGFTPGREATLGQHRDAVCKLVAGG